MKSTNFFIYFTLFISIYTIGNYYVFLRGWQVIQSTHFQKFIYVVISIVLYSSFILKFTLLQRSSGLLTDLLFIISSFWLVFLLYFLFSLLLVDTIKIFNLFIKFLPEKNTISYFKLKQYTFYAILILVISIIIFSYHNARNVIFKKITIYTEKKFSEKSAYKFVIISDLHYSILTGKKHLKKLVNKINNIQPDFIVLLGDIIDETMLFKKNLNDIALKNLKSSYGTFVITGNHEYIGDIKKSIEFFRNNNFKLLIDDIFENEDITLIGRNDYFSVRFNNEYRRKPLKEIINNHKINYSKFIIVADHQPLKIEEAVENNIDLQISGHTHYGQFWPFNLIVKKVYEIPWGYKKIKNTHFYVSSGAGAWGPPIRNMSNSEIIIINIISKQ